MNITWSAPSSVAALAPEPTAALAEVMDACGAAMDPVDMAIMRVRIALIHGDAVGAQVRTPGAPLTEERIMALEKWWASDLFSDRERALLAFVEQFAFSVSSMDDATVEALLATDDPLHVHEITNAVWAIDLTTRMDLVARAVL